MNLRILVVEDETIVAADLQERLESLGYSVAGMATTGERALELAREGADLVLMDVRLRGKMDGIEAAESIRREFDIPVIFLTAYADDETIGRARMAEPFGYLLKPFNDRELQGALEIAFYKHGMERQVRENERKYRTLFESGATGIFLMSDRILDCNPRACEMLGYSREELIDRAPQEFSPPTQPDGQTSFDVGQKHVLAAMAGERQCFFWKHQRKDGTLIDVEVELQAVDLEGKRLVHAIMRDVTENRLQEQKIRDALAEKEILLREVHHRVKNNLQVIISLIDMESSYANDPATLKILRDIQGRAMTIAFVHEYLCHSENMASVDFGMYAKRLTEQLAQAYGGGAFVDVESNGLSLGMDAALTCGLIVNELVTNALKYAFPRDRERSTKDPQRVVVSLTQDGDGFILSVHDNGVGFPPGVDISKSKSLGLHLVNILVKQMKAELSVSGDGGTTVSMRFVERRKR